MEILGAFIFFSGKKISLRQSWVFVLLLKHLIHFSNIILFSLLKFTCPLKVIVITSCIILDLVHGLTYYLHNKCMTSE